MVWLTLTMVWGPETTFGRIYPFGLPYYLTMVNYVMRVACIHFHGFMKIGTFACIRIRVLSITDTLG